VTLDCRHHPSRGGRCPGCALLDRPYAEQLARKRQRLVAALARYPHLGLPPVEDLVPAAWTGAYRHRLKLPVAVGRTRVAVGLYGPGHEVLDTPDCPGPHRAAPRDARRGRRVARGQRRRPQHRSAGQPGVRPRDGGVRLPRRRAAGRRAGRAGAAPAGAGVGDRGGVARRSRRQAGHGQRPAGAGGADVPRGAHRPHAVPAPPRRVLPGRPPTGRTDPRARQTDGRSGQTGPRSVFGGGCLWVDAGGGSREGPPGRGGPAGRGGRPARWPRPTSRSPRPRSRTSRCRAAGTPPC
jgi:hypothetical protein